MFRVNLLPWREGYRQKLQTHFYKILLAILLLGFLIGYVVSMFATSQLSNARDELKAVKTEKAELDNQLSDYNKFLEQQKELEQKLDAFAVLQAQRYLMAQRLNILPELTNDGIALKTITSDDQGMEVRGIGLDSFSVTDFMRNLEKSEAFQGASMQILERQSVQRSSDEVGEDEQVDVQNFHLRVLNRNG